MLRVLVVRVVVSLRGRRLVQARDVEAIRGRRRMLHLVRASLGVGERVRRRVLRLRRGELEGQAVVLRIRVGHGACARWRSFARLSPAVARVRQVMGRRGRVSSGQERAATRAPE
jgi:hypothetical protein